MSRILVVDDDNSILDLMRALLESEGHQVQAFTSGADALADALAHPPDAAVIDLMMPGMNGIDLIEALRYDPVTRDLPVLLCSAYYGNLRYLATELSHGDFSWLRKPFEIEELLNSITRMVALRRLESAPEAAVSAAAAEPI